MRTFLTLLRREYWENRGAFLTTPVAIGALMVGFTLLGLLILATVVEKVNGREFVLSQIVAGLADASPGELDLLWNLNLFGLSGLFNVVLFFVVFFYLLGSLYDDRKDRSILFWKSLPVSDLQTVLSKLAAATLLAPLLMIAALAVTQVILLLIAHVLLWRADLSPWQYLWDPADPLRIWVFLAAAYLVQALWMLPVWGWLLLASAFSRSKPFLWAVVPPVAAGIAQSSFNITQLAFSWDRNWIWKLLGERLLGGVIPITLTVGSSEDFQSQVLSFEDGQLTGVDAPTSLAALVRRLGDLDLWGGVAVGVALVAAAIFIRRYRDDTSS